MGQVSPRIEKNSGIPNRIVDNPLVFMGWEIGGVPYIPTEVGDSA